MAAIDTTPSQVATNALQAIPFGSIIGGPLKVQKKVRELIRAEIMVFH